MFGAKRLSLTVNGITVVTLTPNIDVALVANAIRFDESGGADRDRTGGLLVANQALSQLSYSPITQWSVVGVRQPRASEPLSH